MNVVQVNGNDINVPVSFPPLSEVTNDNLVIFQDGGPFANVDLLAMATLYITRDGNLQNWFDTQSFNHWSTGVNKMAVPLWLEKSLQSILISILNYYELSI